jgi:hypothetical protein
MKQRKNRRITILAGLLLWALASCADPFGPGASGGESIPEGMGLARVRLSAGESPVQSARTTVPNIGSLYFTLEFTAEGKNPVTEALDGVLSAAVALEPGDWTLVVKGYTDSSKNALQVSGRSAAIPVTPGTASDFDVYLTPDFSSGGTGSLDYSIILPAGVRGWLGLYPMDDTPGTSQEIDISSGAGGTASGTLPGLAQGSYQAVIDLYDETNHKEAAWTGAAHIYDGLTTALSRDFSLASAFAECPPVIAGTSLKAKLEAALVSPAGSYTIVLDGTEEDLGAFIPQTLNVTGKTINITIRGNGNTVQVDRTGAPLFTLRAGGSNSSLSLAIQDLTLKGRSGNSVPVVQVESRGTLLMKAGSRITGNTSSYSSSSFGGGGVYVRDGTFSMSGGAVSGNSSSYSGGGVYVFGGGTFSMSGGAVSGNSSSFSPSYSFGGGGVYVGSSGTFSMSGGAVRDNSLSNTNGYGRELLVYGTFKISGEARPERVFLFRNTRYITIAGPLSGPVIPIDLGVTSGAPITSWEGKPILMLDTAYTAGNLASLKVQFSLGNTKMTASPWTEADITGYEISDAGYFAAVTP